MNQQTEGASDEVTLDPQDWEKLRALGHKMLDDMLTYLQNIREVQPMSPPQEAIKDICVPLTLEGEGEKKVYKVFQRSILPYTLSHTKPRFWGAVAGTGRPNAARRLPVPGIRQHPGESPAPERHCRGYRRIGTTHESSATCRDRSDQWLHCRR